MIRSLAEDHRTRERMYRIGLYLTATISLAVFLFPIWWAFKSSLEPLGIVLQLPSSLMPRALSLDNYVNLFLRTNYFVYLRNSLLAALGATALNAVFATTAGYGLTRFRFWGRSNLARLILFAYMFPPMVVAIPLYILFSAMGLLNGSLGTIIGHTTLSLPFSIWIMWQFFQTVPLSYEESAFTCGAGRIRTFLEVALPLALPGIIAITVMSFALSWEDYTMAMVLNPDDLARTLPVGIISFIEQDNIHWGLVNASAVTLAIPPFLFVFFLQSYLLKGFGAGGLKG